MKNSLSVCTMIDSRSLEIEFVQLDRAMPAMANRAASIIVADEVEEIGEVQFPYYSDMVYTPKGFKPYWRGTTNYGRIVTTEPDDDAVVEFLLWRAAGDDFDCAFLMGVPQMQFVNTNVVKPN